MQLQGRLQIFKLEIGYSGVRTQLNTWTILELLKGDWFDPAYAFAGFTTT